MSQVSIIPWLNFFSGIKTFFILTPCLLKYPTAVGSSKHLANCEAWMWIHYVLGLWGVGTGDHEISKSSGGECSMVSPDIEVEERLSIPARY